MGSRRYFLKGVNGVNPPNIFVGGIGSQFPAASDFAALVSLAEVDIENYLVDDQNNVSFYTSSSFTFLATFQDNANITYFEDVDGLLTEARGSLFRNCPLFQILKADTIDEYGSLGGGSCFRASDLFYAEFPNVIDIPTTINFRDCDTLKYVRLQNLNTLGGGDFQGASNINRIVLPSVTAIGSSPSTDQGTFQSNGVTIYVPPAMFTVNGGNLEADLQGAIDNFSATVVSIDDTTAPSAVSDLSLSNILAQSVQLDFTPPSSTNTLSYYEVWIERTDIDFNDKERTVQRNSIYSEVSATGQTITDLLPSTSYNIFIYACDQYGNRSTLSNVQSFTTAALPAVVPVGNIISYYKLNNDSNDSVGSNNGTDNLMTYENGGVVNRRASFFDSVDSQISLGSPSDLQFGDGSTDSPHSISFWFRLTDVSNTQVILDRRQPDNSNKEYVLFFEGGLNRWVYRMFDQSTGGTRDIEYTSFSPVANQFYHGCIRYNGTTGDFAINNVAQVNVSSSSYTAMEAGTGILLIGKDNRNNTFSFNGKGDELAWFDKYITDDERTACYFKGVKGQELTAV